jgi:mannose/cellobiose epimerase-like protein (N-acyl-D-glucosamine 2-epimerase family)
MTARSTTPVTVIWSAARVSFSTMRWRRSIEFGNDEYLDAARHGLRYLRDVHRDPRNGGYAWTIRDGKPEDRTNHAYGVAFVLLAYSTALKAGISEAAGWMDETWHLLEQRYWDPSRSLSRRSRCELEVQRLSRPERQHAHVRSDAGGVSGQRRSALSRTRADARRRT